MTKNSTGKHAWTKYFSVLLAVFVFGMTVGNDVYAEQQAKHAGNIARFGVICAFEKSFNDEIRIEGSQNLKYTDNSKKLSKYKKGQYTAEIGRDQKIRMNIQKHLANMRKGEHQTLANTITNGIARNLLPKIFG